jgi:hypothetical protein
MLLKDFRTASSAKQTIRILKSPWFGFIATSSQLTMRNVNSARSMFLRCSLSDTHGHLKGATSESQVRCFFL